MEAYNLGDQQFFLIYEEYPKQTKIEANFNMVKCENKLEMKGTFVSCKCYSHLIDTALFDIESEY